MGGSHSVICNSLAREMWFWCIDRNLWISAAYLLGSSNMAADKASHVFCDKTEWKLDGPFLNQSQHISSDPK